jgi:small subunit ribosomal protein S3
MPVKKHFINRGIQRTLIEDYLETELHNSGYAGATLQKTPMGTRITIRTSRPGIVIGRRGSRVKELTEKVKQKFDINVPTIDVEPVEVPELNAQIQAEKVAFAIEKGQNYRRSTYSIIRRIMRAGARGVEIRISGKVSSQRARQQSFRAGVISKCGTPADEGLSRGVTHLAMKSGILGIRVKIMPEDYQFPDEVVIRKGIYDRQKEEERKKQEEVDSFYSDKEAKEIEKMEIEEENKEIGLFDDTSDAEESVLKTEDDLDEDDLDEDDLDDDDDLDEDDYDDLDE